MNKIIAIVGMCGSGKSVVCDYYESLGFTKIYFGGVTLDKIKEEGLEINEKNEKYMREKLRKEYGMSAYAIILLPKIEESLKKGNVVLDGLYSWDELKVLKERFEENKHIRYERISKRDIRPLTEESAISRDISEIENLSKAGPIAYADYYILNNSDIDTYLNDIKKISEEILK